MSLDRRLAFALFGLGLLAPGCAHSRPVVQPDDMRAARGVSVRAPFVSVDVPGRAARRPVSVEVRD